MARMGTTDGNKTWKANQAALGELTDGSDLRELRVETLGSMTEAVAHASAYQKFSACKTGSKADRLNHVQEHAITGNADSLNKAQELSDKLVDEAIVIDSRLARKAQWVRSDDGLFADAGLVAAGDDSPCYMMQRAELSSNGGGVPINVVISTDSNALASWENTAAFMAVVKIVQQFRPVNVWWQGAWLSESCDNAGYAFLAPLISNDIDFARVDFVLSDQLRDTLSFTVLHQLALVRDKVYPVGLGRHAERAYMNGAQFVDKGGIVATAQQIASYAAHWLGWDSMWLKEYRENVDAESAMQSLPSESVPYDSTQMQDWKKQYDREQRNRDQQVKAKAKARMKEVKGSVMG